MFEETEKEGGRKINLIACWTYIIDMLSRPYFTLLSSEESYSLGGAILLQHFTVTHDFYLSITIHPHPVLTLPYPSVLFQGPAHFEALLAEQTPYKRQLPNLAFAYLILEPTFRTLTTWNLLSKAISDQTTIDLTQASRRPTISPSLSKTRYSRKTTTVTRTTIAVGSKLFRQWL